MNVVLPSRRAFLRFLVLLFVLLLLLSPGTTAHSKTVTIKSPVDGHDTNITPIKVSGDTENASPGDTVQIKTNNTLNTTVVLGTGDWSGTAALQGPGDSVWAQLNSADSVAFDTITVNYYKPDLSIDSPPESPYDTHAVNLPVTVSGTNPISDSIFIAAYDGNNQVDSYVQGVGTDTNNSVSVDTDFYDFPTGANYEIFAGMFDSGYVFANTGKDTLLNEAKASDTVAVNNYPKEVTITRPDSGANVLRDTDVAGTAATLAGDTVQLSVDGGDTKNIVAGADTFNFNWDTGVLLAEGNNTITARLLDKATGNVLTDTTIEVTGLGGRVQINSPDSGIYTRADTRNVSGTAANMTVQDSAQVYVNNDLKDTTGLVASGDTFDWNFNGVPLDTGAVNDIRVELLSNSYPDTNFASDTTVVNVLESAVAITSHDTGFEVATGETLTISGTAAARAGDSVVVSLNYTGGDTSAADTYLMSAGTDASWSTDLVVPEDTGTYTLKAELLDTGTANIIASDSFTGNVIVSSREIIAVERPYKNQLVDQDTTTIRIRYSGRSGDSIVFGELNGSTITIGTVEGSNITYSDTEVNLLSDLGIDTGNTTLFVSYVGNGTVHDSKTRDINVREQVIEREISSDSVVEVFRGADNDTVSIDGSFQGDSVIITAVEDQQYMDSGIKNEITTATGDTENLIDTSIIQVEADTYPDPADTTLLTMFYDTGINLPSGRSEGELRIHRLTAGNWNWVKPGDQVVDTAANSVSVEVDNFSVYSLMLPGAATTSEFSSFQVGPNPYRVSTHGGNPIRFQFEVLSGGYDLELEIYTITGRLVHEETFSAPDQTVTHDGLNYDQLHWDNPGELASGHYIFHLKDNNSDDVETGQLVIIR